MAEEVPTPIHPTHCPKCKRPWQFNSQVSHTCEYCSYRLKTGGAFSILWDFLPLLVYLALGLAITQVVRRLL